MTKTQRKAIDEVWALFRETDKKISQSSQETDKKISQLSFEIGKLTNKWGSFVENYVAPGITTIFSERGIEINQITQRNKSKKPPMEIDIIGMDSDYVVAIEVKSTLGVDDVDYFLEKLNIFKEAFPIYKDKKVLGAVAGIEISSEADRYAYKKGLFVIVQAGVSIKFYNDEKFKAKEW